MLISKILTVKLIRQIVERHNVELDKMSTGQIVEHNKMTNYNG
jgi:hypothetical protein